MLPLLRSVWANVTVSDSVWVGLALSVCCAGISLAPGFALIVVWSTTRWLGNGANDERAVAVIVPVLPAGTPSGAVTTIETMRVAPGGTLETTAGLARALQPL